MSDSIFGKTPFDCNDNCIENAMREVANFKVRYITRHDEVFVNRDELVVLLEKYTNAYRILLDHMPEMIREGQSIFVAGTEQMNQAFSQIFLTEDGNLTLAEVGDTIPDSWR
jgi:hypothetical protein